MKMYKLLASSLLAMGVCAAFAQTPGPAPGKGPGPGLSAEEKEQRCQANPEKCAQIKESIEKRRAANQARREEWKKKCDADPKACEEKKAQLKQKMDERREQRHEHHEGTQERMQNAPQAPAK